MEKKIVRSYLAFTLIFNFFGSFVFPTYILFLRDNGLSFSEVGLVNCAFLLAVFLFEIPTGVVADYFGRKFSVVLGVFAWALGAFVYFQSHSIYGFILAEVISAFGASCESGAMDAWLKDSLDYHGSKKKIGEIFGNSDVVTRLGWIFGGAVGGYIGASSLRSPWLISAIGLFVTAIIAIVIFREDYFQKKQFDWQHSWRDMGGLIRDSVQYGYREKKIWNLIVMSTFFAIGLQAMNMQWSPFFESKFGIENITYVWLGISGMFMIGSLLAKYLIKREHAERRILIIALVGLIFFTASSAFGTNMIFVLVSFLLHEFARGVIGPVQRGYLQDQITSSDKRATIGSFQGMVNRLGGGVGWLACGFLADYLSIPQVWQISTVFLIVAVYYARRI